MKKISAVVLLPILAFTLVGCPLRPGSTGEEKRFRSVSELSEEEREIYHRILSESVSEELYEDEKEREKKALTYTEHAMTMLEAARAEYQEFDLTLTFVSYTPGVHPIIPGDEYDTHISVDVVYEGSTISGVELYLDDDTGVCDASEIYMSVILPPYEIQYISDQLATRLDRDAFRVEECHTGWYASGSGENLTNYKAPDSLSELDDALIISPLIVIDGSVVDEETLREARIMLYEWQFAHHLTGNFTFAYIEAGSEVSMDDVTLDNWYEYDQDSGVTIFKTVSINADDWKQ